MNADERNMEQVLAMKEVIDLASINSLLNKQLQQLHQENDKLMECHREHIKDLEDKHVEELKAMTRVETVRKMILIVIVNHGLQW